MYSSVYFARTSSLIHYWEYDNEGNKIYKKEKAPLYFYMKSDKEKDDYRSIYGDVLKRVTFENWEKFKSARDMWKQADRPLFESDVAIENRFILDKYSDVEIKIPKLDIFFLDIEVHSESGFPKATEAEHPITIISIWSTKQEKFFIFAEKDFDRSFLPKNSCVVIKDSEQELLKSFISFIRKYHPDILSGWNSEGYDIPYIINRCNKLLGEEYTKNLSPIKQIRKVIKKLKYGRELETYDICGINCIDYLALYRKYHQGEQESFKLGYIAKVEIGETKLEFEGSLKQLYKENWQKYVEYNIQDVMLLVKLDKRKQYMNLMLTICYNCRVPFQQFDKTTRVLDGAFMSRLMLNKIILPDCQEADENEEKFEGAFVFETIPGVYDWVMSFDATSLYPSIMMQHNISPETKQYVLYPHSVNSVADLLEGKEISENLKLITACDNGKNVEEIAKDIKDNGYTLASNGAVYRHDIKGVVSTFVKEWFDKRKYHKKLMQTAEKQKDEVEAMKQDAFQQNYKILINSVYGVLGSKYFRLYDRDNALAVTKSGQVILNTAINAVNGFFKEKWHVSDIGKKLNAQKILENIDLVIAGDTDSIYFNIGPILKSFNYPYFKDNKKGKLFVDEKLSLIFVKLIDNAMQHLTKVRMNGNECKISFKREMIARRAIFLSKKHYAAWVLNMEGIDIEENSDNEIKAKGIEMVKSSTPELVRDFMYEVIVLLLKEMDYNKTNALIKDIFIRFKNAPVEKICKISNVNNIEKYTGGDGKPILGCPGHVVASIGYNTYILQNNLQDDYELIFEGDKARIVYLKESPYYPYDAIAFKEKFPEKLGLKELVDYDIMWNKVFLPLITSCYEVCKWSLPAVDLEDLTDLFEDA